MPSTSLTTIKNIDSTGMLLAAMAAVAWVALAFDLYGIVSSGPLAGGEERIGRAWELLWGYGLSFVLWCFLGAVLYRLQAPGGLLVFLVSAGAVIGAFFLMGDGDPRWPAVIPFALPALLMAGAVSGHWSALRVPLQILAAVPCAWAVVTLALSAFQESGAKSAVRADVREKNLAQVATITEDQPLWKWAPLLNPESGVRDETLAALRKLKRRQADVEVWLAEGGSEAFDLVPLLDLQVSPRLQELVNAQCLKDAAYARTKPGGGDEILERTFFYTTLPALHWIRSHGGDCREGIAQLKAAALEYRDTRIRAKYVKELDDLSK